MNRFQRVSSQVYGMGFEVVEIEVVLFPNCIPMDLNQLGSLLIFTYRMSILGLFQSMQFLDSNGLAYGIAKNELAVIFFSFSLGCIGDSVPSNPQIGCSLPSPNYYIVILMVLCLFNLIAILSYHHQDYIKESMLIKPKEKLTANALMGLVSEAGSKYKAFAAALQTKFNKLSRITIGAHLRYQTPVVIFGVIIALKSIKVYQQNYDRMFFLQLLKIKHQQMNVDNHKIDRAFQKLYEIVSYALNDISTLSKFNEVVQAQLYVYALLNNIAGVKKTKEYSYDMQISYTPQEMAKISQYFDQKVKLIDYDDAKELSSKIEPVHDQIYIVKAKRVHFLVSKSRPITLISEGTIKSEQIAAIFSIQTQQSPVKKQPSTLLSSQFFPEDVECTICAKHYSQFDVLSWNYTSYCYDCIIKPKVNTSAIPQSVIQKYLKLKKFDFSTYNIICPQCKGETSINRYNPAVKPVSFTCKVCQKKICVEHQQYIGDCFCFCFDCHKPTLTIEGMLSKYCMSCRTRLCELCNVKTNKQCSCLCLKCYNVNLVDHQCKERCHECMCVLPSMKACECGRSICNGCYYTNFERVEMSNGKQPMCKLAVK